MFKICDHKGFQMQFDNGWTVSVQFGPYNYCEHYDGNMDYDKPRTERFWQSEQAEIAAWDKDKKWYQFDDDTVKGYCSANEVAEFITMIAEIKETDNVPVRKLLEF